MASAPDVVVRPPVETDVSTADGFERDLRAADPTAVVHVDCSAVTFMDSAGLRVLSVAYHRHAEAGGRLVVVDPSPLVRRLLELTALDGLLLHTGDTSS